jgi:hypothetical protein
VKWAESAHISDTGRTTTACGARTSNAYAIHPISLFLLIQGRGVVLMSLHYVATLLRCGRRLLAIMNAVMNDYSDAGGELSHTFLHVFGAKQT